MICPYPDAYPALIEVWRTDEMPGVDGLGGYWTSGGEVVESTLVRSAEEFRRKWNEACGRYPPGRVTPPSTMGWEYFITVKKLG